MKKLKHKLFSVNPGFLGYKMNISFLAEKLPYSQICGTKVGPSNKNGVKAHELEKYTPEVTKSFVQSRLECARLVLFEGMDNPLEDVNSIVQQLDQISTICRCEYESTTTMLKSFFDQTSQHYGRAINGQLNDQVQGLKFRRGKIWPAKLFFKRRAPYHFKA